ncbi:MAG TPA: hypothetical protein PLZ36_07885 [Armatimonadota bacterium]|nr:hypothetical protein [Armatimonadota bacterium]
MTTTRRARGCSLWAITGCGCGALAIIGILLVFALLLLRMERERRDPAWDHRAYGACLQHLRYLHGAAERFRLDHGRLPARLDDLNPVYLDTPARLRCPLAAAGRGEPYRYTPDAKNPDDALITCANHGQGAIMVQRDGRLRVPK